MGGTELGRRELAHARADHEGGLLYSISKKTESKSRKGKLSSPVIPNAQSAVADIFIYTYIYTYMYIYIWILFVGLCC